MHHNGLRVLLHTCFAASRMLPAALASEFVHAVEGKVIRPVLLGGRGRSCPGPALVIESRVDPDDAEDVSSLRSARAIM